MGRALRQPRPSLPLGPTEEQARERPSRAQQGGRLFGVLDLDSPNLARFDADDAAGLQAAVKLLLDGSDLSRLAD